MANDRSVVIIGGGLVGSLCAIFMAKRHYQVSLYEYREDLRLTPDAPGRSINLAISNRGRSALAAVGLEKLILKSAIPMKGRMIHNYKGENRSIPYDAITNQCIYSVGRNYLNRVLLDEAQSYPNIELFFNQKLVSVDFAGESLSILDVKSQEMKLVSADLVIGADGAFSTLRRYMQETPLFEFSQTYIKHGYLELKISPENNAKMTQNHLHIWPRGQFMMVALPNQDASWTVTVFMPFTNFENLSSKEELLDFFQNHFPDSVALIGEESLVRQFFRVKPSPLVSIKCSSFNVRSKFLLIGDAAHAMVPFYGQGMNCGFEDCLIFDEILASGHNFDGAAEEFSRRRVENAHAICDLAIYNYVEMRDLVMKRSYFARKFLDEFFFTLFPRVWIPLYNSVTFTRLDYKKCLENRHWQNKVFQSLIWLIAIPTFLGTAILIFLKF